MERLTVACVTMNQTDFSKIDEMNIQSNVIFANQANRNEYDEYENSNGLAKMITTDTIGVGVNRNIANIFCDSEIILFADDDFVYYDGYKEQVLEAFDKCTEADVLIFGLDYVKNGEKYRTKCNSAIKKLNYTNILKYGATVIAIRNSALKRGRLSFSTCFGGGCVYGSGEDSLFLIDCCRQKLKIYAYPYILGYTIKDQSSWFEGYNEKYIYDKGAWLKCAFPKLNRIIKWYFVIKLKHMTKYSYIEIVKLLNKGISSFKELQGYTKVNDFS